MEKILPPLAPLSPQDGDIVILKAPVSKADEEILIKWRKKAKRDILFLAITDESSISIANEERMKKYGWIREHSSKLFG